MTLRTGKGGRYRDYTRSIKARQGETGCKGRSIPMEKLDDLVAGHIESGVKSATPRVRSSVPDWRREWDSNPRYAVNAHTLSKRAP